jgi:hypothetical protein
MTGSLLALVALGKQDGEFVGNPEISFFRNVYKHHTHFSVESIPIHFDQGLVFGKKSSVVIPRKADLLSRMVLELRLPALSPNANVSWINASGHSLIKEVTLEIGGVKIDSQTGEFMDILSHIELPEEKKWGYYTMIAKHELYTRFSQTGETTLFIPLQFWFCRHISQALPLVGLQYHEIKFTLTLRDFDESWYSGPDMLDRPDTIYNINGFLHCDYVFLSNQERRFFAKEEHRYLIEQVQMYDGNGVARNTVNDNINVFFNHPVKELFWIYKADAIRNTNDWLNFSKTMNYIETHETPQEPIKACQWKINGHDLMEEKSGSYFRLVNPYRYYNRIPDNFVYVHSFSMEPHRFQPSGHLNFSMLNSVVLSLTYTDNIPDGSVTVYARNYNILEIKNGQAALLYSA